MKLTILIPVYNEEKTIREVLKKVVAVKLPCSKEILVIDDGSTDASASKIKVQRSKIKDIKVVTHRTNKGKGVAIQTGIKHATGDYILIQDADLEYNPTEIPLLLSPVLNLQHFDFAQCKPTTNIAVYGSRFLNHTAQIPFLYLLGNKFLTTLFNLLYATRLTDMETGYKLIPTGFLRSIRLHCTRFDAEPEITALLVKQNIPIIEVPISYTSRTHTAGKKLTINDAWGAVKTIISQKLTYMEDPSTLPIDIGIGRDDNLNND